MNCQEWFFNFVQHYLFLPNHSTVWVFNLALFHLRFSVPWVLSKEKTPRALMINWLPPRVMSAMFPRDMLLLYTSRIVQYIQYVGANKLMIFFSGSPQSILLLSLEGSFRQCCQSRGRSSLVSNFFPTLPRVFFLPLFVKKYSFYLYL